MASAKTTTDHDAIRKWVEKHGGKPARVADTAKRGEGGVLRIDFAEPGGNDDDRLEEIDWTSSSKSSTTATSPSSIRTTAKAASTSSSPAKTPDPVPARVERSRDAPRGVSTAACGLRST